ncbi:MAG: prolyl oligopeptidase family serine peptidase [Bryobacteraceae bacterium]
MKQRFAVLLFVFVCALGAKRPLNHKDYDGWRSISSPTLSRDGRWAAYGLFPQEGDGVVVAREIATGREHRQDAGALPPPPVRMTDEPAEREAPRGVRLAFTRDGRYLISTTYPPKAETDKAKKEKKKPEEMPQGGLLIVDLATGAATRIAAVKSYQVPEKGGNWVAYLKQGKPEPKPAAGSAPKKEYGAELVLRDLASGAERSFPDVLEYALAKDGATLLYTVSSKKEEDNGVYAAAPGADAAPAALLRGKGKYARLVWDREQTRAAFLSDRDDAAAKQPKFKLYLWDRKAPAAAEAASEAAPGYTLSDQGTVAFSRDGSRVLVGCAPAGRPRDSASSQASDDKVIADLWRWNDDQVQPVQKAQSTRERNRTYTAVYHLGEKKLVQIADTSVRSVFLSDNGRYAIGADDHAYRRKVDYDATYFDQLLIDTLTGSRIPVVENYRGGYGPPVQWAPDGRYALFFRDRQWHTISVPEGKVTTITAGLGVDFHDEDDDRPEPPSSYGSAGWTRDGRFALIYDRYDVWQISPDGRWVRNLTEGAGRKSKLQFRVVRLEPEEDDAPRGIDPEKPVLLRAENLETRDTGFFRDRLGADTPPQKLIMGPRSYRTLAKAKEADVILLAATTFNDFPDLQASDSTFANLRRISDANPQKAELLWGSAELVRYRNADGVPLQGVLIKPEGFDPGKKYPMLVYIYERLSQTLHNFVDPRPGTSINASYYVSNGYLVLMPDIVYATGAPGQSALKCVLPAIQAVVDRGFVNENAIGIQGHSWGGYQIAYMVGHTTRFRAAEAGAPVGNMISAYSGIRWGSGMPRQFQYEKGQSRIGGSIWQNPVQFIENSPIFSADRVQTPLLILHNDQDDAVPWYQGIELFLSLRRLGKEAYLFNYNGEYHGLRRRQNQKDYTVRMQQFFDHFLKGAPAPEWMRSGVPYLEREREKEKFLGAAYGN